MGQYDREAELYRKYNEACRKRERGEEVSDRSETPSNSEPLTAMAPNIYQARKKAITDRKLFPRAEAFQQRNYSDPNDEQQPVTVDQQAESIYASRKARKR